MSARVFLCEVMNIMYITYKELGANFPAWHLDILYISDTKICVPVLLPKTWNSLYFIYQYGWSFYSIKHQMNMARAGPRFGRGQGPSDKGTDWQAEAQRESAALENFSTHE